MKFFFDTADIDYLKDLWPKIKDDIQSDHVAGVTTNPNAFNKINANSINDWKENTIKLCRFVSEIRKDDKGVVYVQVPNSNMKKTEVIAWANKIMSWSDGKTRIGTKIAPFKEMLELNDELNDKIDLNVTGTADCSTALLALSYGVRYVSIIPGRMEEKGINAKKQIAFINQRKPSNSQLITGSMRTLEGVQWAFEYGTVPTIGTRVWDIIVNEHKVKEFIKSPIKLDDIKFSPLITDKMNSLSEDFFNQMNILGSKVYEEFKK